MEDSKKLIEKTRQKFIFFFFCGIIAIFLFSGLALKFQGRIVSYQVTLHDLYLKVYNQYALINKIVFLSEKFSFRSGEVNKIKFKKEFRSLVQQLESEYLSVQEILSRKDFSPVVKIQGELEKEETKKKIYFFIQGSKKILKEENFSIPKVKKHFQFLSNGPMEEIEQVLSMVRLKVWKEQGNTFSKVNQTGVLLVLVCILFIIIFWLLVFRPLYQTISVQNRELQDSILQVKAADRSKTDFLANISHEIRTPMTAILGYAEILRKGFLSVEEKNDAIKIVNQNASHLLELIDEILDISKIEAGKFEIRKEKIILSKFIQEVYSLINVKASEKGVELTIKTSTIIPELIEVDAKRLKQILFNIIGNAIKFTDKGHVELNLSFVEKKRLLILKVKDTGIGISKTQIRKLFNPFQQADSSVGREYGGTGLGLVLSKKIAQEMDGDVKLLASKVGVGTTFEISLKIDSWEGEDNLPHFDSILAKEKGEKVSSLTLSEKRVLLVDDAKENARLFDMFLKGAGAHVTVANNGESAIDFAKENYFDIILLDLQMPGKDGFQVIKELRDHLFFNPIVALTAHAMAEERERTKLAGFDGHLSKPISEKELVQAVVEFTKETKLPQMKRNREFTQELSP